MQLNDKLKNLFCTALPEKQAFSIEELLARWTEDKVTFGHLCDWAEQNGLVMGVRVRGTGSISEQVQSEDGIIRTRRTSRIVLAGPTEFPALRTDYLDTGTLLKILTAAEGVRVGAPITYPSVDRSADTGVGHLSGGSFYGKADLVVPWLEVSRMESQFRIGKKAPAGVKLVRLTNRFIEPLLGLLAAVGEKFFGKDEPPKPGP